MLKKNFFIIQIEMKWFKFEYIFVMIVKKIFVELNDLLGIIFDG